VQKTPNTPPVLDAIAGQSVTAGTPTNVNGHTVVPYSPVSVDLDTAIEGSFLSLSVAAHDNNNNNGDKVTFSLQPAAGQASVPAGMSIAGSTGNIFTFEVSAASVLSGHTDLTIPAGWSAPQVSTPASAGYVTVAKGTCKSAGHPAVTGSGPWTVAVAMSCAAGMHFSVTYGAGTGSTRVQAPAAATTYSFPASVKLGTTTHTLAAPAVVVRPGPVAQLAVSGLPDPGQTGVPLPVTVTAEPPPEATAAVRGTRPHQVWPSSLHATVAGWRHDVDPDELFASGKAWGITVRRATL